jgi:phosphatidate cytidylyltransferase
MSYKPDPALRARFLTAIILAPLAIAGILYLPTLYFAIALGLIFLLGSWEWSRIMGIERRRLRGLLVLVNLALMVVLWHVLSPAHWIYPALIGVFWWFASVLWLRRTQFGHAHMSEIKAAVGSLLIIPAWSAAILMHGGTAHGAFSGRSWFLFVVCLIWVADIGAYFSGRRFGKKKLAPSISPGKTREGVYGAMCLSAIYALGCGLWAQMPLPATLILVLLALIVVLFSIVGDLFESLMKRQANLKDSGSLLPGHGGVLDRIDSLLAALPVFAAGQLLLGL